MKNCFKILTIGIGVLIGVQTLASDFTLKIHQEASAASKQYSYTDFEIDLDGNWTAHSMYSNGHQIESIRLYSVMSVVSTDNRTIMIIPQNHHVKGSGGGHAREERTAISGKVPRQVAQLISKQETRY
ncbi:MAG: hypothetical protein ABTR07_05030, partial [Candidatus Competibacter denitrificans]